MILHLTRGEGSLRVPLRLPPSPAEEEKAFAQLDKLSPDVNSTRIVEVTSPIPNLIGYIRSADVNGPDFEKLKKLAEQLDSMTEREQQIFSGALDAESINGLDDMLAAAGSLDEYTFLPNICSHRELGVFLVDTGYINIPEHLRPHINYESVGAEYYTKFGGAYGASGYVRRKDAGPTPDADRKVIFTAHLQAGSNQCTLNLPASDACLDAARRKLQVHDFYDVFAMELVSLECAIPYLKDILPQGCDSVADADKLALEIEGMDQEDGELMKYLSVLSVEKPSTFQEALEIAYNIDEYERVPDDAEEYGKAALRRIGADDEIIDTIDGYMDFEGFGKDTMIEDGVQRTEFGLVRRLNEPFTSQQLGQTFQ